MKETVLLFNEYYSALEPMSLQGFLFMINESDRNYMRRAIELARRGCGHTNPNPMVGAVIVKDGRVIGEGWHAKYGELHAERNAIASLTEPAEGADIYVTLEPCCHYGKTPPCTEAIIENGISRVFIGSRDPNPLVSGKGAAILREHGITVIEDVLKDECDKINPVFFHYIKKKTPYVVLKYAMTADGKIATRTGASKWITGEESRQLVQYMRGSYMAIMAGIGTVLADDPMLNTRIEGLRSPLRIIIDSSLRIPADSRLVKSAGSFRTMVVCANGDEEKINELRSLGVEIKVLPDGNGRVDLKELIHSLGSEGIDSVLVEGGGTLNDSLRELDLIDRIEVFIAPKLFGGREAKSPVEGTGIDKVNEASLFTLTGTEVIGEDVLLTYERKNI